MKRSERLEFLRMKKRDDQIGGDQQRHAEADEWLDHLGLTKAG
nr:hypothetical protein [Kaistia soli]